MTKSDYFHIPHHPIKTNTCVRLRQGIAENSYIRLKLSIYYLPCQNNNKTKRPDQTFYKEAKSLHYNRLGFTETFGGTKGIIKKFNVQLFLFSRAEYEYFPEMIVFRNF